MLVGEGGAAAAEAEAGAGAEGALGKVKLYAEEPRGGVVTVVGDKGDLGRPAGMSGDLGIKLPE